MKDLNTMAKASLKGQLKAPDTGTTQILEFNHDKSVFYQVWLGLQAAGHISKDDGAGGSLYKYWRTHLASATNYQLLEALRQANDYPGYLKLGTFADWCKPDEIAPYHRPYNPNQIEDNSKSMTKEQRKAAMAKLREEVGL